MAISNNMTPLKITEQPAEYIRSIMPEGSRKRKRSVRTTPSEEQMENYDMESVCAIRANDIDTLRSLLEEGKSFDACNRNGESILHLACRRGNLETVRFLLLEARVDANVQDDMGRTALHDVCWRPTPNMDMMALLIRSVSPELLLAEDIRGHSCFDYCRQADWGQWMTFLHETSPVIKRRAALVQSVTSSFE